MAGNSLLAKIIRDSLKTLQKPRKQGQKFNRKIGGWNRGNGMNTPLVDLSSVQCWKLKLLHSQNCIETALNAFECF